ncbi:hypothetical protein H920_00648 [Fukomys damarensis]|uniref:Uncharacterized protein n=1 Tax=Fukomys damarensis TaxID=885580 RepID=A0A091E5S4_FUKDA|nr:hypothetical protein H920_00648 [Fukomys damarensis]
MSNDFLRMGNIHPDEEKGRREKEREEGRKCAKVKSDSEPHYSPGPSTKRQTLSHVSPASWGCHSRDRSSLSLVRSGKRPAEAPVLDVCAAPGEPLEAWAVLRGPARSAASSAVRSRPAGTPSKAYTKQKRQLLKPLKLGPEAELAAAKQDHLRDFANAAEAAGRHEKNSTNLF